MIEIAHFNLKNLSYNEARNIGPRVGNPPEISYSKNSSAFCSAELLPGTFSLIELLLVNVYFKVSKYSKSIQRDSGKRKPLLFNHPSKIAFFDLAFYDRHQYFKLNSIA